MNVNDLTPEQAREILAKTPAADIIAMYSSSGINDLVGKAGKIKLPPPNAPVVVALSHSTSPTEPVIIPKPQYAPPPLIQQAKNLSVSMVEWAKDGFKTVSDEVFWQRINICRGCPWWEEYGNDSIGRCKKCGCTTGKHRQSASQCPLNPPKWKRHKTRSR